MSDGDRCGQAGCELRPIYSSLLDKHGMTLRQTDATWEIKALVTGMITTALREVVTD